MSEHDFEAIRGIPGALPQGEHVVWQGAPDAWRLACRAFHIRAVAAYFAVMLGYRAVVALMAGEAVSRVALQVVQVSPLAFVALGVLGGLALLYSRTTVYTITTRRLVVRFGLALPKAINLPFAQIESAAIKRQNSSCGELAVKLKSPNKVPFLQLWPNVRPWRLASPEPALMALRDVDAAAEALVRAMNAAGPITVSDAALRGRGLGSAHGAPTPEALVA